MVLSIFSVVASGTARNLMFYHAYNDGWRGEGRLIAWVGTFGLAKPNLAPPPPRIPALYARVFQLLEPGAAPLLAAGFPTLVDLTLQKVDDGPGAGVGVPLYLQVPVV